MEKGRGRTTRCQMGVQLYPTLIIFDATGKPVLETTGFLKPKNSSNSPGRRWIRNQDNSTGLPADPFA